MVLTTVSAVLFLVVFLADLFGLHTNPYIGIVFFLVLPALFVIGLVLIRSAPGLSAAAGRGKAPSRRWPRIDLNDPTQRATAVDRLRAHDRQHRHRLAGGVSRRRVHGFGGVLRPGVPHGR